MHAFSIIPKSKAKLRKHSLLFANAKQTVVSDLVVDAINYLKTSPSEEHGCPVFMSSFSEEDIEQVYTYLEHGDALQKESAYLFEEYKLYSCEEQGTGLKGFCADVLCYDRSRCETFLLDLSRKLQVPLTLTIEKGSSFGDLIAEVSNDFTTVSFNF